MKRLVLLEYIRGSDFLKNYEEYQTASEKVEAFLLHIGILSSASVALLEEYTNWLEKEANTPEESPSELKPCPFCGEPTKLVQVNDFFHTECIKCGARTREVHKDRELTTKLWNQRM